MKWPRVRKDEQSEIEEGKKEHVEKRGNAVHLRQALVVYVEFPCSDNIYCTNLRKH